MHLRHSCSELSGVDGAPCGSTVFLSLIEIPFGFKVEIVSLACAYRISGAMYIL